MTAVAHPTTEGDPRLDMTVTMIVAVVEADMMTVEEVMMTDVVVAVTTDVMIDVVVTTTDLDDHATESSEPSSV